jgi:hypothetical protein
LRLLPGPHAVRRPGEGAAIRLGREHLGQQRLLEIVAVGDVGALPELRDELGQAPRTDGKFALLHDLTNCLRIGDVTVFERDGTPSVIEVKTDPSRRSPAQNRRITAAIEAVQNGGPLPGLDRRARLYDLDLPYQNHLNVLRDGANRAAIDGIFTAKLPGDRALLVTDIYGFTARGWTDEWADAAERKFTARLRSAGIGDDRRLHLSQTCLASSATTPSSTSRQNWHSATGCRSLKKRQHALAVI